MSSPIKTGPGSHRPPPPDVLWIPAVEFKLVDEYPVPDPASELLLADLLPDGSPVLSKAGALRAESILTTPAAQIQRLVERALAIDPTYAPPNFANVLRFRTPNVTTAQEVAAALREQPMVEFAEVQRVMPLPGMVTPATDPFSGSQVQHDPPRSGINSRAAWNAGFDGSGVKLIDLERGYDPHEDLPANIQLVHGLAAHLQSVYPEHGTAVLGIVAGKDNNVGGIGVAPGVELGFALRFAGSQNVEEIGTALADCIDELKFGDVLLIDDQHGVSAGPNQPTYPMPIETNPAVQALIGLIKSTGIILVTPAGNFDRDIDPYCVPHSGAVIVGGINSTSFTRVPTDLNSNYGSRVDCHARYDGIVTSGWEPDTVTFPGTGQNWHDRNAYTSTFYGTSATAAIVAGAACLLQSAAINKLGFRLDPSQLRNYLRTNGMDSKDPPVDRVGIMPDLEQCLRMLGPWPSIIRGKLDDVPHVRRPACGESPDMIVTRVPLPNPAPFGQSDVFRAPAGTPLDSGPPTIGYAYVRAAAIKTPVKNVSVRLYAARPSFQPHPRDWRPVGQGWIGNLPGAGGFRTTVGPILWDYSKLLDWDGVSLIAVLDSERLPGPSPHGIRTREEAERFYRNNTIVGVLTRLVAMAIPGGPPMNRQQSFQFVVSHLPGAPTEKGVLLKIHNHMPQDATLKLKVPPGAYVSPTGSPITNAVPFEIPIPHGSHPALIPLRLEPGRKIRCTLIARAQTEPLGRGGFRIAQLDTRAKLSQLNLNQPSVAALLELEEWGVMSGEIAVPYA